MGSIFADDQSRQIRRPNVSDGERFYQWSTAHIDRAKGHRGIAIHEIVACRLFHCDLPFGSQGCESEVGSAAWSAIDAEVVSGGRGEAYDRGHHRGGGAAGHGCRRAGNLGSVSVSYTVIEGHNRAAASSVHASVQCGASGRDGRRRQCDGHWIRR